ncbi:DEAD-box ATP-dependent RNA helicase 24 [Loa loa]|uniref:RNA helicase n=1 Tax=Loa loa TaxID=7209 RepID=A0A1S0UHE6_LOALO|nr:DEAD-box ATP-dependent RNA helicase 24 [Loa loa]EJD75019.1 DEAD-box ATP-dependent RNA helicase 24 [Loa loa]
MRTFLQGRIIDLVKINATNFTRVTFLVFDEADRMFDMGFEAQVQSISDHIRPDRQCLMFSATFKSKVEKLAREALTDPVRIVQGEVGEANSDVIQTIEVLENADAKWQWLLNHLVRFSSVGKVLIFVTKKIHAEDVANGLRVKDFKPILLHGDMLQAERNEKLQAFRKDANILVATDVAARGLDIPEIRTVINFDLARDIDTHVHRIGRTGRAGQKGWAYTLVQESDREMAGHLVRNLESVNQIVPESLLQLAMKSPWFRNSRERGASRPQQRLGLGYKPKTKGPRTDTATTNIARALNFDGSQKEVKNVLDMAKATDGSTNRLQAMKAAFKSSFSSTFRPSSSDEWATSRAPATDPTPDWKRKLEEAAEAVNRQVAASINSDFNIHEGSCKKSAGSSDGPTFGSKKRSRWH